MRLGKGAANVYWLSNKNRKVIKLGAAGDNFGHVQCIETEEVISTYGYKILPVIGKLEVSVEKGNFIPVEQNG